MLVGGAPHDERADTVDERVEVELLNRVLLEEADRTVGLGNISIERHSKAGDDV